MKNSNNHRSAFAIIAPIGILLCFFIFLKWKPANGNCNEQVGSTYIQELAEVNDKHKGVHFFGIVDSTNLQHLNRNNIEWLTLVAWGVQDDYDSPLVRHHNGDSLIILRSDSSWVNRINKAQAAGFKVFLKPHVWINTPSDSKWRSDIFPTNEENWELWKNSYRDYTLRYAKIAEQTNAEMFCLGTEFSRLTTEKPLFWESLIQEVRSVYAGKITYAANWHHEFENITFWDDLDYIGVQAYFPLVTNNYPSVEQISKGWNRHFPALDSIHQKFLRKIIFTEIGYKSTANSAVKPWGWIENSSEIDTLISMKTQANCYQAFFNTVWNKEWFAGVHIWQLNDYAHSGGPTNLDFTPQGKPAEAIITKAFE